jgi:hypothetical protein
MRDFPGFSTSARPANILKTKSRTEIRPAHILNENPASATLQKPIY